MAAKTIFLILCNNANSCYQRGNDGVDLILFSVKKSVFDSKAIRKNNGEKSASESSKMRDKQILGP